MDFHELYFQKYTDGASIIKASGLNFYLLGIDNKQIPDMKSPYSIEWKDEDGTEEYLPSTPLFEAYDIDLKLAYKGPISFFKLQFRLFIKQLITGGAFKFYTPYCEIGKCNCRFSKYKEESTIYDFNVISGGKTIKYCLLEFTLTIRVNDPIKRCSLSDDGNNLNEFSWLA